MSKNHFNVDDTVHYTGSTLVKKHGDVMKKGKIGVVIGRVAGEDDNALVVDFGEAFIVHVDNLEYATFKDRNEVNVVVEQITRRLDQSAELNPSSEKPK
jgi:hypothetical protein